MLLITVPLHCFGSGLRQLFCHSLNLKDAVWMRAVQRPCKVCKLPWRDYTILKLTELLENNSFQGFQKTWFGNLKILAGMEVAFRDGLNLKKGWSLVLRQRDFFPSVTASVQFSHRGEEKHDTRELPSSFTLQCIPPALAALLPVQRLQGELWQLT